MIALHGTLKRQTSNFHTLYPETGPYRRELYRKHLEFFAEGKLHNERALLGGNRTGKSSVGAYEATVHATGLYPAWWQGHRFERPNSGWVGGDTSKTVREIIQTKLIGKPTEPGTGMIPEHMIVNRIAKSGVPEAVETLYVRHEPTGGTSIITFKSYDQKRISFQGTAQDWIWLDEEVDEAIYTECVMRTMKTSDFAGGLVWLTFTPLTGISEVVQLYLPDGITPSPDRSIVFVGWDDIPHLDAKEKAERIKKIPQYQRDARTKGIPQLGSGAIYPIPEDEIIVKPFAIPKHYRRAYGLDVGGGYGEASTGGTGAVWGAEDPDTQVLYLYEEYFRAGAEPSVHAAAIKARGAWIPGTIDPAARGRSQIDGRELFQMYVDLGLELTMANNAVEAGIYQVWDALSNQKLRVFSTMERWKAERNLYRRDEKGRVVKQKDHLMDATRYLYLTGRDLMIQEPVTQPTGRTPVSRGSLGFAR